MKIIFSLLAISLFVLADLGNTSAQNLLVKNDIEEIIENIQTKEYLDFNAFLEDIDKSLPNTMVQEAIRRFREDVNQSEGEYIIIYRLMGIFVRHQYQDEVLEVLKSLVEIPTDQKPKVNQHENPNIIKFGEVIEEIADEFGLRFRNVDNRVFEVILEGSENMEGSFGIYTHGDVVPADKNKWVLEDGTQLDPYKMQIIGDKIYGRGTEDDKASIVASLFAMKAIKESGLEVKRDIRLIIETTEETGSAGFRYYRERFDIPEYNVVLDNLYPVVTAEKGFVMISAEFNIREASSEGVEVVNITGGTTITQIPASSTVTLRTLEASKIKTKLEALAKQFVKMNGRNFRIESAVKDPETLEFTVFGVSAHSSIPETGVNPIPRAFVFLHTAMEQMKFRENHFTDAIKYVFDNYGLDFYGKKMGIDYSDDFMGPLTVSLTVVTLTEDNLKIVSSGRPPKGKEVEDLKTEIEEKLGDYKDKTSLDFDYNVRVWNYMYRNPKGQWINILLNIFGDITGKDSKPVSSNGGTTAKFLPNAVSFGPGMPGEKYMGHTANEYKKISNLLLDAQMFTEMMLRIGNLDEMVQ
jgi:predicted dipeptidase